MGLRTKFNLVMLAAFAVGFFIAVVVLEQVFVEHAREQVLQNARIMMTEATAIRNYTAQDLQPLLPQQQNGKFVAETIPAYAAQKNFKDLQAQFPGYTYREPALNPTNPMDRAQDWEADIIGEFRNNPSRQEFVVERDTPLGPTLNMARPIKAREECLGCHSVPSRAPAALTQTYGTANGFGWKPTETIGAQVLSLPMAIPFKLAQNAYVTILMILVAIFAAIVLLLNLLLHFVVIVPIKRVSAMADAVSLGDENAAPYIKPGKDEISSLSVSFNRMRESLKHALEMIK